MATPQRYFDLRDEKGVLRISIAVTLLVSALGIVFGLVAGSYSITFDGFYSLIDASMSLLSLVVVNLITSFATSTGLSRRLRDRFSMGFWHLEPMVLVLNGTLLISVALYAFFNAIVSILQGGRELEFGWSIVYAAVTVIACATIALVEARANRRIKSEFVRLDVKGWTMSACITGALLVAFCIGYGIDGTSWAWIAPYIDPFVLAMICVIIIPVPVSTIRRALADIFLVTPGDLKTHVDAVASAFVKEHGFLMYRAYVARVGRSREIELYFIVPPDAPPRRIQEWDALRDIIGERIGGEGPNRWLTVVFTGDREWAE